MDSSAPTALPHLDALTRRVVTHSLSHSHLVGYFGGKEEGSGAEKAQFCEHSLADLEARLQPPLNFPTHDLFHHQLSSHN